jgi:hypothetical protein
MYSTVDGTRLHSSHEGTTPMGKTFNEFLGSTYDKEFLPLFDKFLGAVYGAEFISILKSESQLIIHIDKNICEARAMPSLSHEGTPDNSNDSDAIAETRRQGPSEYELRRQANIAENQKPLASLGLSKGGSGAIGLDKSSKKVKRKKGEKEKKCAVCLFCGAYPTMITFHQIANGR